MSLLINELNGKRLALLKEAVPTLSRVAVLVNSTNPMSALGLRETEARCRCCCVPIA